MRSATRRRRRGRSAGGPQGLRDASSACRAWCRASRRPPARYCPRRRRPKSNVTCAVPCWPSGAAWTSFWRRMSWRVERKTRLFHTLLAGGTKNPSPVPCSMRPLFHMEGGSELGARSLAMFLSKRLESFKLLLVRQQVPDVPGSTDTSAVAEVFACKLPYAFLPQMVIRLSGARYMPSPSVTP